MGNSTVSHCRLPVLGNIDGQFIQNHRRLITSALVSEPPPGPQIGHLSDRLGQRMATPTPPQIESLRATLEPGLPATLSDSQIFSASPMPHRRCEIHEKGFGCLVEELKVGDPPIQPGAPIAVIRGDRRVPRIRALISH